ncbi:hypothetical protein XF30_17220 [Bradyrhizobium sp. SUTN9-2]|uniref:hypothetical protein n=1 Tax=Bradyrhizobium sp. SUTN9-2 TaxID=1167456 RepID=UPI000D644224|nr:hypothetical protein [Bradyrhizobium sp. SUTN9-2]PWE78228.1 hypothetical protein XF30_17220 [Bradyrhizobium sp. SUTN9-2]
MSLSATHVLLEMPTGRPDFDAAWIAKASEAEALWSTALADHEFHDRVELLHGDGMPDLAAFAREALDELKQQNCAAAFELYADGYGTFSREFGLMVRLGFFVYDGVCYRLALPRLLTSHLVRQAAVGLCAVGEYWGDDIVVLTPERQLHMHHKSDAEAWQSRQRAMRRLTVINV